MAKTKNGKAIKISEMILEDAVENQLKKSAAARAALLANPSPHLIHIRQTVSLKAWLDRCIKANVPHVPAKWCPFNIKFSDIATLMDGNASTKENTVAKAEKWLKESGYDDDFMMWRWDFCAPDTIKYAMHKSINPQQGMRLEIDDPRFIEIFYSTGFDEVSLCTRPWVDAKYHGTHPVEFRVFCFRNNYQNEYSVSSYYPQRDLTDEYLGYAIKCEMMASALAQTEDFKNGFTADFILGENDELLFLEGGPAWGFGADPCCIDPKKMEAGRIVLANEFNRKIRVDFDE